MTFVIVVWLLGMTVFAIGIALLVNKENFGFLPLSFGLVLVFLVTFVGVPEEFPSGLPRKGSALSPGKYYKVASVYVAGQNVYVGVEMKVNNHERLFLYQFPRVAFDDYINIDSKRLVIVEANGFKKPVLK